MQASTGGSCTLTLKPNAAGFKKWKDAAKAAKAAKAGEGAATPKGAAKEEEPKAAAKPSAAETPKAAAADGDKFAGLGRLQLVKLCRAKALDYKAIAKDIPALKKLLMANDP